MSESKLIKFPIQFPAGDPSSEPAAVETPAQSTSTSEVLNQLPDLRNRMNDVVDGISDGFALYDPQDRLVLWNEKFAEIISYAKPLLKPGVDYETLLRECAEQHFAKQQISGEDKEAWIREAHEFQQHDGTYERWTQDGRCYLVSRRRTRQDYVAVVWTDVTDKKRAEQSAKDNEQFYRDLFESSLQGIVIHDRSKIYLVNAAFLKLFGLKSVSALASLKDLDALMAPHERKRLQQMRRLVLEEHSPMRNYEFQGLRRQRSRIWVQASTAPITWKGRSAIQSMFVDITEKKEFEELLLARKLESLGTLAHGIALEFHKNFSAIMTSVQLAKMEAYAAGVDQITELLGDAQDAGAKVSDLTQEMLLLCTQGVPVKENTTIEELLKESLPFSSDFENVVPFRKTNASVRVEIKGQLHRVRVDKSQLIKALRSLIAKGLQSMKSGGTLRVTAANYALAKKVKGIALPPGQYVRISIMDEGGGLPEEVLERFFDPYVMSPHKGGGLALTSAYSIVKQHDGVITVASRLGKGTRVNVILPANGRSAR